MTLEQFNKQIADITKGVSLLDIHTSPDFQCDQTGGFPVSLCACFEKGKAWLELNYNVAEDVDVSAYEKLCADFGIRQCCDAEQFNGILRELGEDAIQSGELFDEDEGQAMDL